MLRLTRFGVWFIALLVFSATYAQKSAKDLPPIREFDIETIARLGREIYRHDQLAWVATDVLMDKVGMDKMQQEGGRGWIVDTSQQDQALVRFVRAKGNGVEAAYDIVFVEGKKPKLVKPKQRELTKYQQERFDALHAAGRALSTGQHPWCGGNPNNVVLDDPDGSGFLVYFLRAKPSATAVPVGGHYRITVSSDGKIEELDQLFASCLTMDRNQVPQEAQAAALAMTHFRSKTPLETHVFLSLQERLPFMVILEDGKVWAVEAGKLAFAGLQFGPDGKPQRE